MSSSAWRPPSATTAEWACSVSSRPSGRVIATSTEPLGRRRMLRASVQRCSAERSASMPASATPIRRMYRSTRASGGKLSRPARARPESHALGALGVDVLDRVAGQLDVLLCDRASDERRTAAARDDVDPGDHLRDAVLDLKVRVHLQEAVTLTLLVDEELAGRGAAVSAASRSGGCGGQQLALEVGWTAREFCVIAKGLFSGGINVRFFRAFTRIIEGRRP